MTTDLLQARCDSDEVSDEVKEKVFRTISDVAKEVGVEQYVLRFWESKFPQINPVKRRGRRLYDGENVAIIKKIKHMLYDRGYTIRGAQLELKRRKSASEVVVEERSSLVRLLRDMVSMRDTLVKKLNGM
ncbi:MerR family transcriptional regulator [Anaplasma capra]|uniref:MerR family transcriptional regulator n=1 Tax=Anaplasma capra TaxID=1562740 RepID=UPI0021D57268|nr:MerR family transcriptional regulator [Anaplasma capra]MCU7611238.1 MerR family transcriptional regulator [Anaplasma capra]MCU7612610.1 MerR family transcriptional regulator [Anaplasma capra]